MSFFARWFGGGGKGDDGKGNDGKGNDKELPTTEMDTEPSETVDPLKKIQLNIAEIAANPSRYKPEELAAELNRMSQILKSQNVNAGPKDDFSLIPQSRPMNDSQVRNEAGGFSFKVCDMTLLKRFLVIGTESGTYHTNPQESTNNSVKCVARLLKDGHAKPLLDLLEEYSKAGRIAKEDPLLLALALCATYNNPAVQKDAYERVARICNIPTKLFCFLEMCQRKINRDRQENPPDPQPNKKRKAIESGMSDLSLSRKEASEQIDTSIDPIPAKKRKLMEKRKAPYKTVNTAPKKSSGWGRMRRKAISAFYTDSKKDPDRLLYLVTKYKQRHDWNHKQVLGYAHPKIPADDQEIKTAKDLVLTYATRGNDRFKKSSAKYKAEDGKIKAGISDVISTTIGHIEALENIMKLNPDKDDDVEELLKYLKKYGVRDHHLDFAIQNFGEAVEENPHGRRSSFQIVREHLPTGFLKNPMIWSELIKDMPMTALIRNLGKMSSLGLFDEGNERKEENISYVRDALTNAKRLQAARVHPIKVLIALLVYKKGGSDLSNITWRPNLMIAEYLEKAFYLSFTDPDVKHQFITNQKYMLCLDVSGSMTWQGCYGCELMTPAMAAAAMALVTLNLEDNCDVMAFGGKFQSLTSSFQKHMTVEQALTVTRGMNFGATDCSLPMLYANERNKDVDVFIVYTDSDTWSGRVHPPKALADYNKKMGKQSKLIVCAMQSNGFTIADPEDPNMMDLCGFDTNVPEIIATFAKGELSGKCGVCTKCKAMNRPNVE